MSVSIEDLRLNAEARRDWYRSIVSLRESRNLFASLVDDEDEARILMEHEIAVKPYGEYPPLTHRPFEFSDTVDPVAAVINWPFEHPAASRFSAGRFGCWYGGSDLETTIYETAFHFWQDLDDSDATRDSERIIGYRRVHLVSCSAMLFDLRPVIREAPDVYDHPVDLSPCRALGDEAHRNALPGFLTYSARDPRPSRGTVAVVLNPDLLATVSQYCYLTYHIDTEQETLTVERTPGETLIQLRRNELKGLNPSAYSG